MEVQPSLVLLQKTLLNVEGLGRQLYPDLDLWQTAFPYLENWNSRRLNPLTFLNKIQESIPIWIEQLPNLPQFVMDNLGQNPSIGALKAKVLREKLRRENESKRRMRSKRYVGMSCVLFAGISLVPTSLNFLQSIPSATLIFVGFGIYFLYFDR